MTLSELNEQAWEEADQFNSLTSAVQIGDMMWPSVASFNKAAAMEQAENLNREKSSGCCRAS